MCSKAKPEALLTWHMIHVEGGAGAYATPLGVTTGWQGDLGPGQAWEWQESLETQLLCGTWQKSWPSLAGWSSG
jgi:hypothetical protein